MTAGWTTDLIEHSNSVWSRLERRFEGMSDDEYLWEPADGCWSIRSRPDGTWSDEFVMPSPDPAPFTTIAWRMWHLIDLYGENRASEWLGVEAQGAPIGLDDPDGAPPPTAQEALQLLDRAHARWNAHLTLVSDESLRNLIGPAGGHFAEHTKGAFVLHMLDEFAHHGAEISLLRDLWRWQHPVRDDELVERVIRGDRSVLSDVEHVDDATATRILGVAASYARWDLVREMVAAGVRVGHEGRTPLHQAAVAGELDVVQALVAAGADIAVRDPDFEATPLEWARFLDQRPTAAWLESQS